LVSGRPRVAAQPFAHTPLRARRCRAVGHWRGFAAHRPPRIVGGAGPAGKYNPTMNPDPVIGRFLFVDGAVRPVSRDDAGHQAGNASPRGPNSGTHFPERRCRNFV